MDRYGGPLTALTIVWHRRLYLAIIMDRYRVLHNTLIMAMSSGIKFPIIMDRYIGPLTTLTIALLRVFYLAIIMDCYRFLHNKLIIALKSRPLHRHYNGPS
jgi:hypothetical protein